MIKMTDELADVIVASILITQLTTQIEILEDNKDFLVNSTFKEGIEEMIKFSKKSRKALQKWVKEYVEFENN